MPSCRRSLMDRAGQKYVTRLLLKLLLMQSQLIESITSDASFLFSLSHRYEKQLCSPILIPESLGTNVHVSTFREFCGQQCRISHKAPFFFFCGHHRMNVECHAGKQLQLISVNMISFFGTFLWTIYWKFSAHFGQKVEVKQKSLCCLKKKKKEKKEAVNGFCWILKCCQLIRFGQNWNACVVGRSAVSLPLSASWNLMLKMVSLKSFTTS